jgi:hypothetical protein
MISAKINRYCAGSLNIVWKELRIPDIFSQKPFSAFPILLLFSNPD